MFTMSAVCLKLIGATIMDIINNFKIEWKSSRQIRFLCLWAKAFNGMFPYLWVIKQVEGWQLDSKTAIFLFWLSE